ncbi:MAG: hypothetical protein FWH17_01715 [Oscillospiraceae bacterium]|nr:hypothetical protein [Oscillospiraceae bacterium]
MKKRTYKRFFGLILTLTILLGTIASGAGANEKNEPTIVDYVREILPHYLMVNELNLPGYWISNPLVYRDWGKSENNQTLFFVFDDKNIVGQLEVYSLNNEFQSIFMIDCPEVVQTAFDNFTPVAFGIYNDCYLMRTKSEDLILSIPNKLNPLEDIVPLDTRILENIVIDYSALISPMLKTRSVNSIQLNATVVPNETVNGVGICWAAAVGSVIGMRTGGATTPTARTVYDRVDNLHSGTPVGDDTWITRAYESYNFYLTIISGTFTADQLFQTLSNGRRALHISMVNTNNAGHSLVISGVTYANGVGGSYTIVDSNYPSTRTIGVSAAVLANGSLFNYNSNSGLYTNWHTTRYIS